MRFSWNTTSRTTPVAWRPTGAVVGTAVISAVVLVGVGIEDDVRTFRISTNTLGAGFIEALANSTLLSIRDRQPASMRGTATMVPVLEAPGEIRVGRFGWKNQHASLQSFAADAYLNEMGITSPLFPDENTSSGRSVAAFDQVADPEDDGEDVEAFANFMRSTKAPSRGPITADVQAGERSSTRLAARPVTYRPSSRRQRARGSMAAPSRSRQRWGTRSSAHTATS
jgi:hypothetical protein